MKKKDDKNISIDCVIFNYDIQGLKVLLVQEKGCDGTINWGLASECIKEGDTIESTAHRILKKYIGLDEYFLEQLKAFGYSSNSSLQENISIGYYALAKVESDYLSEDYEIQDTKWCSLNEIVNLSEKHNEILSYSLKELRNKVCQSSIGFNLLPEKFTLLQVKQFYEEILGIEMNTSNFRRKILQMGLVLDLNEKEEDVSHRAAKFYRFNAEGYQKAMQRGFNFGF